MSLSLRLGCKHVDAKKGLVLRQSFSFSVCVSVSVFLFVCVCVSLCLSICLSLFVCLCLRQNCYGHCCQDRTGVDMIQTRLSLLCLSICLCLSVCLCLSLCGCVCLSVSFEVANTSYTKTGVVVKQSFSFFVYLCVSLNFCQRKAAVI